MILYIALAVIAGGLVGYVARKTQVQKSEQEVESKSQDLVKEAETKAKEIVLEAKDEALKISETAKKEEKERRDQLLSLEKRLTQREENIDRRLENLEKKEENLKSQVVELENIKKEILEIKERQKENLSKITKLTPEKAKEKLLAMTEKDIREDLVSRIKKVQEETEEEAEKKAKEILTSVIQRMASEVTAETTVSSVALPSDEMKGRVIGKEGRNIQTLEKLTGCDIIIDETPETLTISGFDPVRRAICKLTLERLLHDGRINPARIEESFKKAETEIEKTIKESGEDAVYELGITGIPGDMVKILGRLRFRTSYGQSVLKHSMEAAYIGAALAAELGANVDTVKKAALLHDLGKAQDREMEETHTVIARDLAKKYGLSEAIVHAIEAHHEDVPFKTIEAIIVQVADAISSARPGARRDTLEAYTKRLESLEKIANSFSGVEKSFAIQAGREIRIIIKPEEIDDLEALKLAKDIAGKVEKELKYPGQIKVNVIRETRAVEYAK